MDSYSTITKKSLGRKTTVHCEKKKNSWKGSNPVKKGHFNINNQNRLAVLSSRGSIKNPTQCQTF